MSSEPISALVTDHRIGCHERLPGRVETQRLERLRPTAALPGMNEKIDGASSLSPVTFWSGAWNKRRNEPSPLSALTTLHRALLAPHRATSHH